MGFLEAAGNIGRLLGEAAQLATNHREFAQILASDRQSGMQFMQEAVQNLPKHELDKFENDFLVIATTTITDPAHRRRAIELYAWLKMAETHQYGQFQGFIGNG